jgi:hypothetical protein
MSKYPNGYKDKLDYWKGEYEQALVDGNPTLRTKAADKLRYFTDRQLEWSKAQPNVLKFWSESSYVFEDKEKAMAESLIIAVDMGDEGTKTIGEMPMSEKETVNTLLKMINQEAFGS